MRSAETGEDQEPYTDGLLLRMGQPGFSGGALIRDPVQLVEEKALLDCMSNGATESASPTVFIGSETWNTFLNPFRVIICQYGVPKRVNGTVCVIGAKHMGCAAALGGVLHLSAFTSQMVYGIQGDSAD